MEKELLEERKKKIYELICDDLYVPMKIKEMAILLQIPKENKSDLKVVLDELLKEGKIEISKKGKYSRSKLKIVTGVYERNARGFGFLRMDEEQDIFISDRDTNGAYHKDLVQVVITKQDGRHPEGYVKQILERGMTQIVGTYQKNKNFGFVIPDNLRFANDIFIPLERSKGAVTGHKVVVEITHFGNENKKPEGIVKEIIGHVDDPGTDIMSIVRAYELPTEFSEKIQNQIERISQEVSSADIAGRKDLRSLQMVTIDGEDAKDLDDAVSLEMDGENYRLGVHIADVTNYVQENSALDKEAIKRGTSVYLVDRVIPMLPHELSNGICSLNEGVDRLALSCIMLIDPKGTVIDHEIAESVIRVDKRMSYTEVKQILEKSDENVTEKYQTLVPMFEKMEELANILRNKRRMRGSIDFDFPESKIILDEQGHPVDIKPYDRNTATKIIEDFMLAANETVAQDFYWQEIPFVYRTHDNPDPEKIQKLELLLNNFGYGIKWAKDEIHPKEFQKLLTKIEGTDEEALISRLTLRSMKQAKYTTFCTGHFGLATSFYCHFTSPIRRYPDLQIHRIIKETIRGKMEGSRYQHYEKILPEVANHASEMERRADEAERETDKLKKVEYMKSRIGQEFDGVISSLMSWGIYVELPNTVEGMIHVTRLTDDMYYYDEERQEMVGRDRHKVYKLGQRVKIRVVAADKVQRTIDFELAGEEEE